MHIGGKRTSYIPAYLASVLLSLHCSKLEVPDYVVKSSLNYIIQVMSHCA